MPKPYSNVHGLRAMASAENSQEAVKPQGQEARKLGQSSAKEPSDRSMAQKPRS